MRFRKTGDLRLTSHRDLMRLMERLFRRAEIAVCESEGFRPKPRFHYPASLALGMSGLEEVLEVDLAEETAPSILLDRLNAQSVPGLQFTAVDPLPPAGRKGQASELEFCADLTPEQSGIVAQKLAEFVAAGSWIVERNGKSVDLRPLVDEIRLDNQTLTMRLQVVHEAGARPRDVLEVLGLSADEILSLPITRTRVQMTS